MTLNHSCASNQAVKNSQALQALMHIVAQLRDPDTGCPWDLKQTHQTLKPYLLEESYEVIEAIDNLTEQPLQKARYNHLKEELGDVLLQVLLHSQIACDNGCFNFETVCQTLSEKLVRRHPHVFGDVKADDAEAVSQNWEAIKILEKQQQVAASGAVEERTEFSSVLDGVALSQPALSRARQISERAVATGFAWPNLDSLWACVMSEFDEFKAELEKDSQKHDRLEDEMGDILFATVNLARQFKVDPEVALTRATAKFIKRFHQMEQLIDQENVQQENAQKQSVENVGTVDIEVEQRLRKQAMSSLDFESWDALWNRAKRLV